MTIRFFSSGLKGVVLVIGSLVALFQVQAVTAQDNLPGGEPLPGTNQSVADLEEQVA